MDLKKFKEMYYKYNWYEDEYSDEEIDEWNKGIDDVCNDLLAYRVQVCKQLDEFVGKYNLDNYAVYEMFHDIMMDVLV